MSDIFSRLWSKAVDGFHAADAEFQKILTALQAIPGVKQVEDNTASAIRQQFSNAIAFADSELAQHGADVASMAESAVDTWVMGITHGMAAPGIPGLNALMDFGEKHLIAIIQHGFADARAKYNLPPANSSAAPTVAGVVTALTGAAVPQSQAA